MPGIRNGNRRPSTETGDDDPALRQYQRLCRNRRRQFTAAGCTDDERRSSIPARPVLNHYDTGLVVPVTQREGAGLFRARICSAPAAARACACRRGESLDAYVGTRRVRQHGPASVADGPRDWVAARITPFSEQNTHSKPHYGRGALLNYDVYTNHSEHTGGGVGLARVPLFQ